MKLTEQLITIELCGEEFKFKADEGNVRADEVADFLKREIEKAETEIPTHAAKSNKLTVPVLVALNISKQYIELLHKHLKFVNSVSSRTARLGSMIRTKQ